MEDYYQILGVPEDASEEQIKKRFRELAKIYHPDKGGDPEKFKQILKAYQILSDKKLREEYDFRRKIWQTIFSYDFRNYDFKYETKENTKNESDFKKQKEANYQLLKVLFWILSLFLIFGIFDELSKKRISIEDIWEYWDEIKPYIDGKEAIEACNESSGNCYSLEAEIEDGVITKIYFPNGGYLTFLADINSNGEASDIDKNGDQWNFMVDPGSRIIQDAIEEWANDNNYKIVAPIPYEY